MLAQMTVATSSQEEKKASPSPHGLFPRLNSPCYLFVIQIVHWKTANTRLLWCWFNCIFTHTDKQIQLIRHHSRQKQCFQLFHFLDTGLFWEHSANHTRSTDEVFFLANVFSVAPSSFYSPSSSTFMSSQVYFTNHWPFPALPCRMLEKQILCEWSRCHTVEWSNSFRSKSQVDPSYRIKSVSSWTWENVWLWSNWILS